jgi:hypothetical protein
VIHVRIVLEEHSGLWRMSQIRITKDGRRMLVTCGEETFPSHAHVEKDARRRAMEFLTQDFGSATGDILWEILPPPSKETESRLP